MPPEGSDQTERAAVPALLRELSAAEAALGRARAETSKLWEAARKILTDPCFQTLKHQGDIQRAVGEAELEESMLASSWQLFRGSLDRKLLAEVTRLAAGCVPWLGN